MSTDENCGLDTQLLVSFLKKHFHDEKPTDVISVEVKNAVPKGDNYASLVYRVKMNCLTAAGKKKQFSVVVWLHGSFIGQYTAGGEPQFPSSFIVRSKGLTSVIVKTELKGEGMKEAMKGFPVFRIETRVYTTIIPMMEDLIEEFDDKRERLWPNLLGYQPYNMIAFGDLSDVGYVGVNRRNSLDFNHSKLVLRNLARFHAMSKVLLDRGLITSDDKGKLGIANEDPVIDQWYSCMLTVLSDALESHWGNGWAEIATKLRNQITVISGKVRPLANEYDKRFDVFNHGDPWTCNLLFKYMEFEENIPISVKFLDYQMGHINSFIWDLIYFLITSTIPSVRRSRLDELFEAYQQSLEKNLNMFNYSGYIPTLEDVKTEWKRIEYTALCFCLIQPFMTAETTNAFDMEKLTTHPPHEVVDESVLTDGKALEGIGEDLRNLALHGLI